MDLILYCTRCGKSVEAKYEYGPHGPGLYIEPCNGAHLIDLRDTLITAIKLEWNKNAQVPMPPWLEDLLWEYSDVPLF